MPRVRGRSVQDRPGRLKLLLRRQRRLARPAGWAAGLLGAVLAAALLVHGARSAPTVGGGFDTLRARLGRVTGAFGLRVREVVIEGRANTPEPLLRAALGVGRGAPILGVSLAAARARIETLSWVQNAAVERRLPGTIVVQLTERRPFAIWQNQGRFVLIDRAGQVVAEQDVAPFGRLPLVVGAGAPVAAATLLDALARYPALQARVVAAVRVGERRWNLSLSNGPELLLPEGHEVAALQRLMDLQTAHDLLDRPLLMVDLRLPDRLVVRPLPPRPDPATQPPNAGPDATPNTTPNATPNATRGTPQAARKPT